MKNLDEESAKVEIPDLQKQVENLLNEIEHERNYLNAQIIKYEAACLSAGFKIAQIQYRRKNDKKDIYGMERWYKWDSHLKK